MNKSIKKIFAYLLVFMLVITGLYLPNNITHAANDDYMTSGSKVYKSNSDGVTNVPTYEEQNSGAGAFMDPDGNGRIWVDKSVVKKNNGNFEVDLSAITQEYISTVSSTSTSNVAADVVFVLDGSGSMVSLGQGFGGDIQVSKTDTAMMERLQAMIKATNEAIKIIMDANPENRVGVYIYSGTVVHKMMPLDSYSIKQGAQYPSDYLVWGPYFYGNNPDSYHYLKGSIFLNKDLLDGKGNSYNNYTPPGNAAPSASLGTGGGTATQAGITVGITEVINNINQSNDIGERIPFTFLLSDGGATYGQKDWWDSGKVIKNPGNGKDGGIGSGSEYTHSLNLVEPDLENVTATLILSAAKMQDDLAESYKNYNTKYNYSWGSTGETSKFYTVGLGSDINGPWVKDHENKITTYRKCAWMGLNPEAIDKVLAGEKIHNSWSDEDLEVAKIAAQEVKDKIGEYFKKAPEAVRNGKDYSQPENYDFSDYYSYAESYNVLNDAFNQLAKDVASATKEIKTPVIEQIIGSTNASIYFKDIIGEGFVIDDSKEIKVTFDGGKEIVLVKNANNTNEYIAKNGEISGKVILSQEGDTQVLEWYITAADMKKCLIQITDFDQVTGLTDDQIQEMLSNKKLYLKYNLKLKDDVFTSNEASYFTNKYETGDAGTTTVTYTPVADNNYYYYTIDKVGIVGELEQVGFGTEDHDIRHFVKGDKIQSVTTSVEYKDVYITTDMVNEDMKNTSSTRKLNMSMIGQIMNVTADATDTTFNAKLAESLTNCVQATEADKSSLQDIFAYRAGIQKIHDHTVSKSGVNQSGSAFDNNKTFSASLVSRESFTNGIVKMELGNNGRVDVLADISMTGTSSIAPGGIITYTIKVDNPLNRPVSNIVVEDAIPSGLTNIVATNASVSGNKVTWTIPVIQANSSQTLTITAKVPNSSRDVKYENIAKITSIEGVSLSTAAVSEKVETIVNRDIKINVLKNDEVWNNHGKTYQLASGTSVYDLDEIIPDGKYKIYEKTASSTKNTNKEIEIVNGVGTSKIDYYTLEVNFDNNINSIQDMSGLGVVEAGATNPRKYLFMAGEKAMIKPIAKQGFELNAWVYDNNVTGATVDSDHVLTMPITKKEKVSVTSKKQNSQVNVTSRLNDNLPWDKFDDQTLVLVDDNGNVITDFSNVPNGKYTLKINDVKTIYTVAVDSNTIQDYDIVVDYYSLTLGKNPTIKNPDYITSFEGEGVYLKGETVHMHANVNHSKAHFEEWTITEGQGASTIVTDDTGVVKDKVECSYITVNTKTTVQALADAPAQNSSPLIIKITKDGAAWNEQVSKFSVKYVNNGVEENVTDKGNLAKVGEYRIYSIYNVLVRTFTLTQDQLDNKETITQTINYYTVALKTTTGIQSTGGAGIFLEGTSVTIDATVDSDYHFSGWTGTNDFTDKKNTFVLTSHMELTAYANPYNALNINVRLDNALYTGYTGTVKVKDVVGKEYTDLAKLNDGIYFITADDQGVGKISLTDGVTELFDINYYTLTLNNGTGIDSTEGGGIYLEKTPVTIKAKASDKYTFVNWTGSSVINTNPESVIVNKPLTYMANAVQSLFEVNVTVNKDDVVYTNYPSTITLKKDGGTLITDLTRVPNGDYTVQVDGVDTYQKVTVNNDNADVTLDYYTVTLDHDTGIESVAGAGVYLKGSKVTIEAKANIGFSFDNWSNDQGSKLTTNKTVITVTKPIIYKANSRLADYRVYITPKKDDVIFNEFRGNFSLKASDGTIITDLGKVPNGKYIVQVDNTDTYLEVEINNGNASAILDYYTLTLDKDTGIETVTGSGVYLKGTEVEINAVAKDVYEFVNWTGSHEMMDTKTKVIVDEKLTYKANSNQIAFNVEIDVNKDGSEYAGYNKDRITLKDTNDNIISDLGKVPNGKYIVQVDNADTYLEVEVNNSNVSAVLDYYSLDLRRASGINQDYITGFEGIDTYLKGSTVHIQAIVDHSKAHFTGWEITEGTSIIVAGKELLEYSEITILSKTVVEAKADTPPVLSSPLIIKVNKDGTSWNEQVNHLVVKYVNGDNEIIVTDKGNLTGVGTYKIYDGEKVAQTFIVSADDVQNGRPKKITIDYFTLALTKGLGVSEVKGQGTYLKGTEVSIEAIIEDIYSFEKWTGSATLAKNPAKVTMNQALTYTANAKQSKFEVKIDVNRDDNDYVEFNKEMTLIDKDKNVITDLSQVPNGKYTVQVDGTDTYLEVEVKDGNIEKILDYYTLTLNKGMGVNEVKGQGTYLKGTEVRIEATAGDVYSFDNWTGDTTLTKNPAKVRMNQALTYTANAKQSKYEVTINVNKDNGEYIDFDKVITLIDKDKNVITDLTKVPNGKYTVQVEGTNTYLEVEVKDGNIEKTLDYYTLTLNKDSGIQSITGAGTYLKGSEIYIDATTNKVSSFVNWTGSSELKEQSSKVIVNEKLQYTANSVQTKYEVTINVNKDDVKYDHYQQTITLVDTEGNVFTDLTAIPNGNYTVQVDGENTYLQVTVKDGQANGTLDYYSVTLVLGTGIDTVSGQGVYLKNSTVSIDAQLKEGYTFKDWRGDKSFDKATSAFKLDGKTVLEASAKEIVIPPLGESEYQVTVEVNKDNQPWNDFNGTITLKKEDGTIITDLTKVPNGKYTVVVDNVLTNKTIEVKDSNTQLILNYYTLTLDKGNGVKEVVGSGVYLEGSHVDIKAIVENGYHFVNWTGDYTIDKEEFTLVMNGTITLIANATKPSGGVNTGDQTGLTLPYAITLAGSCAVAIILLAIELKKQKYNEIK